MKQMLSEQFSSEFLQTSGLYVSVQKKYAHILNISSFILNVLLFKDTLFYFLKVWLAHHRLQIIKHALW